MWSRITTGARRLPRGTLAGILHRKSPRVTRAAALGWVPAAKPKVGDGIFESRRARTGRTVRNPPFSQPRESGSSPVVGWGTRLGAAEPLLRANVRGEGVLRYGGSRNMALPGADATSRAPFCVGGRSYRFMGAVGCRADVTPQSWREVRRARGRGVRKIK